MCPHIPFIVIGTKLDLRRPDPYVSPHDVYTRPLRLTPISLHSTTPQPQVRPHPFSRFTFRRPTVARSNTSSSHSSEEKRKREVKTYQYPGDSQSTAPLFSNREQPSTTKPTRWYEKKCKDSIYSTSSPKLHHAPLANEGYPPNSPSLPSASGSSTNPSPQVAHLAPLEPPVSKRPSLNVLSLNGVDRSLNPFKRTRVTSIAHPAGHPSPTTQPPYPRRPRLRLALVHRHTTDTVTTKATISGGSGSVKSVVFSGVPLTLGQLASGEGTIAPERELFNQSQVRALHPIPPPMSPIASVSSIGEPVTNPILASNAFGANPLSPPRPPRPPPSLEEQSEVVPMNLPSAQTPANGLSSPGSPEIASGASPRREGDRDGGRSRNSTPQRSKRNLPISYDEANTLAREIGASAYIECSALTLVNVVAIFEEAVKVAGESSNNYTSFG